MTVEEALYIVAMDDFRSDQESILSAEVKRLRELGQAHISASRSYAEKAETEIDRLTGDNEVLRASLAQARSERDGLRMKLEGVMG